MTKTNLGRICFVPRGTYSASESYKRLDVVSSPDNGISYVAIADSTGAALTDETKWQVMVDNSAAIRQLKDDVAAITPDDTVVDGKPWTSKKTVDSLCMPLEATGNPVQVYPVEGYPLGVKVSWEPTQAGEGDPSPDNVRPITGRDSVSIERTGRNLFDLGTEYNGQWYSKHSSVINHLDVTDDKIRFLCALSGISFAIRIKPIKAESIMFMRYDAEVDGAVGDIEKIILVRCFDKNGNIITDADAVTNRKEYNTYYDAHVIKNNESIIKFRDDVDHAYFGLCVTCFGSEDNLKVVTVSNIQLETGSTATPYEPYTGSTTDIALPETVYGGTLDVETGVVTVEYGHIASYAGESLPGEWISDRDVYASDATPTTGAQVVYKLATPYTIQLTPQQIAALSGVNTLYTDAGTLTVTGREDPRHTIVTLTDRIAALESAAAGV